MKKVVSFFVLLSITVVSLSFLIQNEEEKIISFEVNPKVDKIMMFWKNAKNQNYLNFDNLKNSLEKNKKKLAFAMNGGMYKKDFSPQGLYIEKGVEKNRIDTLTGSGNFYLKPNGIFYLDKNRKSYIVTSNNFLKSKKIEFATQSGPMLVVDNEINSKFKKGSKNLNIRNGVGVLPNGNILFAISKEEINFYDFAEFFKDKGCKNALYLDGFVSRMYLPEKNYYQIDGNFGVIIAVVK